MNRLQCDAALSDAVLQAARAAIPAHADSLITLPTASQRNRPLMPLLVALLDAAKTTAAAVADNAWDDCHPLDQELASELVRQANAIGADIANATQCPDATGWSLPSMTGKELV
jgi:hypothetical protein